MLCVCISICSDAAGTVFDVIVLGEVDYIS